MDNGNLNDRFGLSHLTNSIFSALEVSNTTDHLLLGKASMRECLILIDGMGQDAFDKYADQFPILASLKLVEKLNANFPSTTATSLST